MQLLLLRANAQPHSYPGGPGTKGSNTAQQDHQAPTEEGEPQRDLQARYSSGCTAEDGPTKAEGALGHTPNGRTGPQEGEGEANGVGALPNCSNGPKEHGGGRPSTLPLAASGCL